MFLTVSLHNGARAWSQLCECVCGSGGGGGGICTRMRPQRKVSSTATFTLAALTSVFLSSTLLLSNSMSAVTDPIMMASTAKLPVTYKQTP